MTRFSPGASQQLTRATESPLPARGPLTPKVEVAARKAAEESEKKALRTAAKQVRISAEVDKRWCVARKSNSVSVDE